MKKVLIVSLLFLIHSAESFAQCPMCKTAVESNLKNDGGSAGLGLNDGILYLLAAPYLLIGGLFFFWYRNKRKKVQSRQYVHE
jgi:hypothetical protein